MIILTIINTIAIATFYLLLFLAQKSLKVKELKYENFKKRKNNQEN